MEEHGIILFDGVCNLCNGFVQRIIAADQKDFFRFAALQSDAGQQLLKAHPNLKDLKSIVYLQGNEVFTKSSAALKIGSHLGGFCYLVRLGYIFPSFLRDAIYEFVAKHRYKWFGEKQECMVPTPALKAKFLN